MTLRNYTNNAVIINLTAAIDADDTVLSVTSTTTMPSVPFIAVIERNTSNQEVVLVTGKTATTLTVTRGYDGSPAAAHDDTSILEHSSAAIDYREANDHVNDPTKHFVAYPTSGLPSSGNAVGHTVWDSTLGYHKYWTGSLWAPMPGTLLGLMEITSNVSPEDGDGPSGYGWTPSNCIFPFVMPTIPSARRVRLEFNCRNAWYDRGDRREVCRFELRRNDNNAVLCAKDIVSESWGGDTRNHGVYVVGWLDNGDLPAGAREVKLVMWCDDGGIGFQAGSTYPATFSATVV